MLVNSTRSLETAPHPVPADVSNIIREHLPVEWLDYSQETGLQKTLNKMAELRASFKGEVSTYRAAAKKLGAAAAVPPALLITGVVPIVPAIGVSLLLASMAGVALKCSFNAMTGHDRYQRVEDLIKARIAPYKLEP